MLGIKQTITKLLHRVGDNQFEHFVDISGYNSSANMYEMPSDGYLFAYNAANTSSYVSVLSTADDGSTIAIGGQNQRHALYVRKGMKCYVTGSFSSVRFTPIGGGIS